jgi:hypothetical protein
LANLNTTAKAGPEYWPLVQSFALGFADCSLTVERRESSAAAPASR